MKVNRIFSKVICVIDTVHCLEKHFWYIKIIKAIETLNLVKSGPKSELTDSVIYPETEFGRDSSQYRRHEETQMRSN